MKLLVLGGTNFLGRYITEAALASGNEVTLFNRGQRNPGLFPEAEHLVGDRNGDLAPLKGRQWDAVVDTCGFVPRVVRNSARLLAGQAGHYTFVSSQSVYNDCSRPGIDEDAPVDSMPEERVEEVTHGTAGPVYEYYGALKAMSEQAAEAEMPGRVLAVRAGLIAGPHDYTDRLTYWVDRIAKGGDVLAPGRPERSVQLIDVHDLADWILKMAAANRTGVYNATGPSKPIGMGQLLEVAQAVTGGHAQIEWVDEAFLREQGVQPWTDMPIWIPETFPLEGEEKPALGFLDVSARKAMDAGLSFRPLAETLKDIHRWQQERDASAGLKAGITADREQELLKLWRNR